MLHAERPGAAHGSQDRLVILPSAVAVLDGASGPAAGGRDGGWYASVLADELAHRLPSHGSDLAGILRDAIRAVVDRYELRRGAAPSSTVALLRWTDEKADALVLGDSVLIAHAEGREEVLTDQRLSTVAAADRLTYRRRLLAGQGYDAEHRRLMQGIVTTERTWRNRPGGYWIAEADPHAPTHAIQRCWPTNTLSSVVLATDGVARGIDLYGTFPSWHALTGHARRYGAESVLDAIRRDEHADPDGRQWPRSKPSDDQALVIIQLGSTLEAPHSSPLDHGQLNGQQPSR